MTVIKHRTCRDVILLRLECANLDEADLAGTYLSGAVMPGMSCKGTIFRGANLRNADLRRSDLRGAEFGGANLRGADLQDANLSGASLVDANLTGANLRGADLRSTDLSFATLTDADLADVQSDRHTRWPGHEADVWFSPAPELPEEQSPVLVGTASPSAAVSWSAVLDRTASHVRAACQGARSTLSTALPPASLRRASGMSLAGAAVAAAIFGVLASGRLTLVDDPVVARVSVSSPAVYPTHEQDPAPNRARSRGQQPRVARQTAPTLAIARTTSSTPSRRVRVQGRRERRFAVASGVGTRSRMRRGTHISLPRSRQVPTDPAPRYAAAPRSARPTLLASYTGARRARSDGDVARHDGALTPDKQPTEKPGERPAGKRRPSAPRLGAEVRYAWGNPEFHYGSGYDMYTMHMPRAGE